MVGTKNHNPRSVIHGRSCHVEVSITKQKTRKKNQNRINRIEKRTNQGVFSREHRSGFRPLGSKSY